MESVTGQRSLTLWEVISYDRWRGNPAWVRGRRHVSPKDRNEVTSRKPSASTPEGGGPSAHPASSAADETLDIQITAFLAGEMEMIRLFAGWARSVAGHRAWGFQDSEDVVQATLLALVKNLRRGQFKGGNLRAYVRRIAKNMCVDNYDRLRRQGTAIPLDEAPEAVASSRSAEDLQRAALLDHILDRLEEGCRRIVQLAYVEGYSRAEIGAHLGISEEAARVRLFRCIRTARAMCDSGTLRNETAGP